MYKRTPILMSLLAAVALTVSACGDDEPNTAANAEFNNTDVTFAQEMIPTTSRPLKWPSWLRTEPKTPK